MARPVLSMLGSRQFIFLYLGGPYRLPQQRPHSYIGPQAVCLRTSLACYGATLSKAVTLAHTAPAVSRSVSTLMHAQAYFAAAIYSVVSFLACVAPRMTFQLYGIIPIPAWLAVAGIFTYDTYSAINDKVSLIQLPPHPPERSKIL